MTYLLDTHYIIWSAIETRKIPRHIKAVITDPANSILVSAVSFWEISLKVAIGKLILAEIEPSQFPGACRKMGFEVVDLSAGDSSTFHQLKAIHHRDPFDRMLIWQAIRNNYTLISSDKDVKKYGSDGLKLL